eukprot:m.27722 g.27722  ORF g.27722 m.27722 type:complete len:131 (+) comp13997_c0_seq1:391-783(+)
MFCHYYRLLFVAKNDPYQEAGLKMITAYWLLLRLLNPNFCNFATITNILHEINLAQETSWFIYHREFFTFPSKTTRDLFCADCGSFLKRRRHKKLCRLLSVAPAVQKPAQRTRYQPTRGPFIYGRRQRCR